MKDLSKNNLPSTKGLLFTVISLIIMSAALTWTMPFLDDESTDYESGFQIDMDDLRIFDEIYENRVVFGPYNTKIELYLEMSRQDDDRDFDGISTLNNCLQYIKRLCNSDEPDVNDIVSFVRSIEYTSDQELYSRFDWAAYPVETLFHGKGDCEDLSILFIALAYRAGYECGIALFEDHAVALVSSKSIVDSNTSDKGLYIIENDCKYYIIDLTDVFPIGFTYNRYSAEDIISFGLIGQAFCPYIESNGPV